MGAHYIVQPPIAHRLPYDSVAITFITKLTSDVVMAIIHSGVCKLEHHNNHHSCLEMLLLHTTTCNSWMQNLLKPLFCVSSQPILWPSIKDVPS